MATLTIPGGVTSHVLPDRFHFLSKGVIDGNVNISDSTYLAYVKALRPEGWRLISAYYFLGTPLAPHSGDGVQPWEFGSEGSTTMWPDLLYADHNPHFLLTLNGGPPDRASSRTTLLNGSTGKFDTTYYSASSSVEGSPANSALWLDLFQRKFPGNVRAVEYWNEPTNAGKLNVARGWYQTDPDGSIAQAYGDVYARYHYQALDAIRRPEVLLAHPAFGNVSDRNGTGDFQKFLFGSTGYGSQWPWPTSNLAAPAYDLVTVHGYGYPSGNYQPRDQANLNTFFYPPPWGSTGGKAGYLAAIDYLRTQLPANVQIAMTEAEPAEGNSWGATGKGVAYDTAIAIVSANRQGTGKIAFQAIMDVNSDPNSLGGGVGDQFLSPSGGTWIRLPRYWGAMDLWGKFLKKYKRIVTVPMYTGDTAVCSWGSTPPGLSPQISVNGVAFNNSVQRIQAVVGYDASGNMGILVLDVALTGTDEQLKVNLPFIPVGATFTPCPASYPTTQNSTFTAVPVSMNSQTFTTGSGTVPKLLPGMSMLIELFTTNGPPPIVDPGTTPGAKISTVADNANDNALGGAWLTADGSSGNIAFAEQNQRWEFICGSGALSTHFYEIKSVLTNYDCTSDACSLNLVTANTYLQLHQMGSSSVYVGMRVSGGNLEAFKHISAADVVVATAVWNSATMAYVRIREASGTTYWEYASDPNGSWTTHFSVASPMTMSQVQIRFGATGATASTTVALDNLNTVGIATADIGAWTTAVGVNATTDLSPPPTPIPVAVGEWSTATPVNARIAFSLKTMGNVSRDPSGS